MHSPGFGFRKDWKALYRAAMQESDRARTPQRITQAEQAAISRVRELFYTPGTKEEKDQLKEALYTLRVFSEHLRTS